MILIHLLNLLLVLVLMSMKVFVMDFFPFNPSRYPNGANGLIYKRPPSPLPRNHTCVRKHQKKKGSCPRSTKPNKLNLIWPLPDFRLNSVHHLLKYDREQSHADKSSASFNYISIHKNHTVYHLNSIIATSRPDTKIKK